MAKDYAFDLNGKIPAIGGRLRAFFKAETVSDKRDQLRTIADALITVLTNSDPGSKDARNIAYLANALLALIKEEYIDDDQGFSSANKILVKFEKDAKLAEKKAVQDMQYKILESIESRLYFARKVLGPHVEFVLHNTIGLSHDSDELSHSVICVAGDVTDRIEGAPLTNFGRTMLKEGSDKAVYRTTTEKNSEVHELVSGSMIVKDWNGNTIGILCINVDVTEVIKYASEYGVSGIENLYGISKLLPEQEYFEQTPEKIVKRILNGMNWEDWKKEHGEKWPIMLEEKLHVFSTDRNAALRELSKLLILPVNMVETLLESYKNGASKHTDTEC